MKRDILKLILVGGIESPRDLIYKCNKIVDMDLPSCTITESQTQVPPPPTQIALVISLDHSVMRTSSQNSFNRLISISDISNECYCRREAQEHGAEEIKTEFQQLKQNWPETDKWRALVAALCASRHNRDEWVTIATVFT